MLHDQNGRAGAETSLKRRTFAQVEVVAVLALLI